MTDKIVVLSTCDNADKASEIAKHLVEKHLAACVNILPGARSIFRWKGKVEDTEELVLMIKTRRDVLPSLLPELQNIHPYTTPEIIALPVVDGAEAYLHWVDRELSVYEH